MKKRNSIMLAAPCSNSGKTLLTCALLQAMKDRGLLVSAFKCGPDYIDPMFHKKVIGVDSCNLDTFFTGEQETAQLFKEALKPGTYAVMEGVMGLYDGLGGVEPRGSSYDLARVTGTPVILVVDAHGMGRSVIPLISGFMDYDRDRRIAGVILNRISETFYQTIKPLIEEELSIKVFGFFPVCADISFESRHLGLKLPDELENIKIQIKKAAQILERYTDVDEILRTAQQADVLAFPKTTSLPQSCPVISKENSSVRIAVADDEAFCFYYAKNLQMLEAMGAELVHFSPLHDKKLPDEISGLLLGGGYPELYAERLSKNVSMRRDVADALKKGMPSVAECGGFLYLHSKLQDMDGTKWDMVGTLPGTGIWMGRSVRFGYVELKERNSFFLPENEVIRGHEFHYYDSTDNGSDCLAVKPASQKSWDCIWEGKNHWWGFPHLYYPSNPKFAQHFVKEARDYGTFLPVF